MRNGEEGRVRHDCGCVLVPVHRPIGTYTLERRTLDERGAK